MGNGLLQYHDKMLIDEELLLTDEWWFFEMESTFGEDTVNIVEITTKDFNFNINCWLASAGFKRFEYNFEISFTVWVKCYQTALYATKRH